MNRRRGFTLVELVVALSLALAVAGVIHWTTVRGLRTSRAQAELLALQDNVRVGAVVLAGELAGVGYDEITAPASAAVGLPVGVQPDLLAIEPGAVRYLAERGSGRACAVSSVPPELVLPLFAWRSERAPRATDSLLLFAENDSLIGSDDAWLHLGVVSTGRSSCPDGTAGIAIRLGLTPSLNPSALSRIAPGAPLKLAEVMELRYYASDGRSWLGLRSVSTGEAITPFAGPFADSSARSRGITFRYRDGSDEPTSSLDAVRSVEVDLVGVTDQPVLGRSVRVPARESLAVTTRIALRNTSRP